MFEQIFAESGTKFVVAAIVVLLGLLCLALVLWIVRGRPSSPFIRGGRNRTPRLAVLDAAAIDTRRRLVLLRRDNVEHLVMIGGPTDIVIETRIVTTPSSEVQAAPAAAQPQPEPTPVRQPAVTNAAEMPAVAAPAAALPAERRAPPAAETVSGMGKVLYTGENEPAIPPAAARVATQPVARPAPQQAVPSHQPVQQQITTERRAEQMLDQARQRVLPTASPATGHQVAVSSASAAAALRPAAVINPAASAADNPALVSEFEKMLEAEMTIAAAGSLRPTPQQAQAITQGAAAASGGQPEAKSRQETEAEMARLLGEISANRKG